MRITIAMTSYNGSEFIIEQLDSILAQTRQPDELIISDDGSSDNTVEVVKKYIADNHKENSWRMHINEHNKGYARNFIETALMAQDGIVFFCDQDDIWEKERLAVMSNVMEENPEINLLCNNLEPFYYNSDTRKWNKKDLDQMTNDGSLERHGLDYVDFHLKRSGCTMCIRRRFLERIEPYWVAGWAHDDFVWKMAAASDSCAIIQYKSMKRRMHLNNASVVRVRTRDWRINQISDLSRQYAALEEFIESLGGDKEKKAIVDHNIKTLEIRKKVIVNKHIWQWIFLLTEYSDCYPRRKGLYLDLYLSIFKKYKGAN